MIKKETVFILGLMIGMLSVASAPMFRSHIHPMILIGFGIVSIFGSFLFYLWKKENELFEHYKKLGWLSQKEIKQGHLD